MTYDYFIAGRTRNKDAITPVVAALRAQGKTVYCFLEHSYAGNGISFSDGDNSEAEMEAYESIHDWQTNPTLRKIYESDMTALKNADSFMLVLPAGLSGHMELGAAFGLGKKCYAIGTVDKVESLYLMLDGIFENIAEFLNSSRTASQEKNA